MKRDGDAVQVLVVCSESLSLEAPEEIIQICDSKGPLAL